MPMNALGRKTVPLTTWGGLSTIAQPHGLPAGASPRAQNVDFEIGSVFTRDGLTSKFVYDGGSIVKTAGLGTSSTPPNIPWSNPTAVEGTSEYASVTLGAVTLGALMIPGTIHDVTGTNTPWTNPNNVVSTVSFTTNTFSVNTFTDVISMTGNAPTIPIGAIITGVSITCKSSGVDMGLTFSLDPALTTHQTLLPTSSPTFQTVGSPTYLWGQTITPASLSSLTVYMQGHKFGGGANTLSVNNLTITVFYTYTSDLTSDQLLCTEFGFDISSLQQVVSLGVSVNGFCTERPTTLTAQLVNNGALIGQPQSIPSLPVTTPSTVYFIPTAWFADLSNAVLNSPSFGVSITATSAGAVSLQDVQITANVSDQSVNFNYIKTGNYQLGNENNVGDTQTLALDSDGNLWADWDFSGELSLLRNNLAQNCFAKSVTKDDKEFICFSTLTTGADLPLQYVPNADFALSYLDRISQVGPGAAPRFTTSGSSSTQAPITAWSITSNVVTFTANNAFTVGEVIYVSGLVTGSFLNGLAFNVVSATGSNFTVNFTYANASATENGTANDQYSVTITSIMQPAEQVVSPSPNTFDCILQSAGPGSTVAGNVITFYYKDAQQNPIGDTSLINAYNNGQNPYVYISGTNGYNGTYQVTGVNTAKAPGGQDTQYYFTVQATSSTYAKTGVSSRVPGNYQQTVATITTASPVAGLTVNDQILLSNVSTSTWDGTYTVTGVLNGSNMVIKSTAVAANGVGTFGWDLTGAGTVAPLAGAFVDITGTLGGGGALNGSNQTIATVTPGPSSGQFTVNGYTIPAFTTTAEQSGQATTAGNQFTIDPGPAAVGTTTSPIFTAATSGQLTIVGGTTVIIGSGTRQGTVFFETRNGFQTAPAPPVTFTTPSGSNYIYCSNLPLGPPNVIRRWIAFTEAGQNNVAGGSFYTIPSPVQFTVNGITYISSALVINDNTSTTFTATFTDNVLLSATEIDVQGNDLFNEIELGNPAWTVSYAGRQFYGLCNAKIQNFENLSFDAGYLANPGGVLLPLGWQIQADPTSGSPASITSFSITSDVGTLYAINSFAAGQQVYIQGLTTGTYFNNITFTVLSANSTSFTVAIVQGNVALTSDSGTATPINLGATLLASPIFGNSFFIQNSTAAPAATLGMIYQSAYQDQYGVNILQPNTLYSVRVTCRSNAASGSLVVDLTGLNQGSGFGATSASYSLPCTSMTSSFVTYTGSIAFSGNLANVGFGGATPVPTNLQLRLYAENLPANGDIEIDRIEIFPTQNAIDKTTVYVSYIDNPEAIDAVTGQLTVNDTNTQPVNGAIELFDSLYLLKTSSMFVTEDSPSAEPNQWDIKTVSNTVGAIGPNAFDFGEQWFITACKSGLFLFVGHQPMKIMHEISAVWNAINWTYGNTIWVKNDVANRKIYVGVPLPTGPGTASYQWVPDATPNAAPTIPNVVLMCSYEGLESAEDLSTGQQLRETMFSTLVAPDARRKWSIWTIASPYADYITQNDGNAPLMFGSGNHTSSILALDPVAASDYGVGAIPSRYVTYGFCDPKEGAQNGMGTLRKRWVGFTSLIEESDAAGAIANCNCSVTFYPNTLNATYPYVVPGGITLQAEPQNDVERPLNVGATRVFVEFETNLVNAGFNLSALTMIGNPETHTPLRGISS